MDRMSLPMIESEDWAHQFEAVLQTERGRMREFIERVGQRVKDVESQLTDRLALYRAALQARAQELDHASQALADRQTQLAEQESRVTQLKADLQSRQDAWQELRTEAESHQQLLSGQFDIQTRQLREWDQSLTTSRQELEATATRLQQKWQALEQRQSKLDSGHERLDQQRQEIDDEREKLKTQHEQLDAQRERIDEQRAKLDRQREQLDEQREQFETQRVQLDQRREQLDQQRQALDARRDEVDRRHAQLDARREEIQKASEELSAKREEFQRQTETVEQLRQQVQMQAAQAEQAHQNALDVSTGDHQTIARLRVEVQTLTEREQELVETLQRTQREETELGEELATAQLRGTEIAGKYEKLREEYETLQSRYESLEAAGPSAAAPADGSSEDGDESAALEDIRRRHEMAMEDLRSLRQENEKLREQVESASSGSGSGRGSSPPTPTSGAVLNWEAEKQRILAALESDFDDNDPVDQKEKLSIEQVVRRTDRVIAEKDRIIREREEEIAELRATLARADSRSEEERRQCAVGAASLGEMIDSDEIIQQQRAQLEKLQAEWKEKLRQAEVELSVERAKLARQRLELETRAEAIGNQPPTVENESGKPAQEGRATRGRWLARLGLGDDDAGSGG